MTWSKRLLFIVGRGCGNCKCMKSVVFGPDNTSGITKDYPDVQFVEMDKDDEHEFGKPVFEHFAITTIPTLIYMVDNIEVGRISGLRPASFVKKVLDGQN